MATKQPSEYEQRELERLKNVHEYYYKRGSNQFNRHVRIDLILLGIGLILYIIHQVMYLISQTQGPPMTDSPLNVPYITLIIIDAIVILAGLIFASNTRNLKEEFKRGSIYPKQKHLFFPFDGDFTEIPQHPRYQEALTNPDLAFYDPTYVHRIAPEWTRIDTAPNNVRWISPRSRRMTNRNIAFAILPLTIGTWRSGPLVLRVFARNHTGTSRTLNLKYYPVLPTQNLIKTQPATFLKVSVPGNSIVYKDMIVYNIPGTYALHGVVNPAPNLRVFTIVDWWTVDRQRREWDRVVSWTEYHSEVITAIQFIEERSNPFESTAQQDGDYMRKLVMTFALGHNPFISPSGMKEVLIYALTSGDLISKEMYRWKQEHLKKWRIIALSLGGTSVVIAILLMVFSGFNIWGLLIIAGLVAFSIFIYVTLQIPESKYMDLVYRLGLTNDPAFIALEDIELSIERNKQWFALTAGAEKIRNLTFPADFCLSFEDMRSSSYNSQVYRSEVDRQRDKIFRYPQYRYRLQQVNLPSLYYVPALEPQITEIKMELEFDIPDRTVEFIEFKPSQTSIEDQVLAKDAPLADCTNCDDQFDSTLKFCPHCGSPTT